VALEDRRWKMDGPRLNKINALEIVAEIQKKKKKKKKQDKVEWCVKREAVDKVELKTSGYIFYCTFIFFTVLWRVHTLVIRP
jgi:hypothetical protein